MIRDTRLLAMTAAALGAILGTVILLIIMTDPIWAINFGLIIGIIAGAGTYLFKEKQEKRSIRQTVRENT